MRLLLGVIEGLILSLDIPLDCHDKILSVIPATEFNLKYFLIGRNIK